MLSLIPIGVLGWATGILVNYLSDVLPRTRRLSAPTCGHCGQTQVNLAFFIFPKRCIACNHGRGKRVWLVEAIYIAAAMLTWLSPGRHVNFPIGWLLLAYLGLVAVIDIEHRVILHQVSLAGAIGCLVIGSYLHGIGRTLIGGAVGFSIMLLLYYFGILLVRLRYRNVEGAPEEGLGFGDVNLSGIIGLVLGWPGVVAGLVAAILSAGLASLIFLILMVVRRRYSANLAIPYGPFLVLGVVYLLFLT